MNNLFYDLPEYLQDKIIRMNPHPLTDLFDDFYLKYTTQVNKRNTPITKKQRKLWSRVYYNSELDYYSMTPYKLFNILLDYYEDNKYDRGMKSSYQFKLLCFLNKKYNIYDSDSD